MPSFFHCNLKTISRKKGQSISDRASYITGEQVRDSYTGRTYTHNTHQERIMSTGIIAPSYAPSEVSQSVQSFTDTINEAEGNSARAQTGRQEIFALPNNAAPEQCEAIVKDHIRIYTDNGYAVLWAIHSNPNDPDNPNVHAHLIVQDRPIGQDGKYMPKRHTEIATDPETGERLFKANPDGTPQKYKDGKIKWVRKSEKQFLDRTGTIYQIRQSCADALNVFLPPDRQVSALSYKAQGIDLIPTVHEGVKIHHAEEKNTASEPLTNRRKENNARRELNEINAEIREIEASRASQDKARQVIHQPPHFNPFQRAVKSVRFHIVRIFKRSAGSQSTPEHPKSTQQSKPVQTEKASQRAEKQPENYPHNPMYKNPPDEQKRTEIPHTEQPRPFSPQALSQNQYSQHRIRTIDEVYGQQKDTSAPQNNRHEDLDTKLSKARNTAKQRNQQRGGQQHSNTKHRPER